MKHKRRQNNGQTWNIIISKLPFCIKKKAHNFGRMIIFLGPHAVYT